MALRTRRAPVSSRCPLRILPALLRHRALAWASAVQAQPFRAGAVSPSRCVRVQGCVLLSDGWFPVTAPVGVIDAVFLSGFSLGVVPLKPGRAVVWAFCAPQWPRRTEVAAELAIGAWTGPLESSRSR